MSTPQVVNRREFVRGGSAAALAVALEAKAAPGKSEPAAEWRNRNPDMAYRRLGRTNYMVSEIVCGGNTIAPDNFRHVEEAIERGLNYLDTAPAYGRGLSESGYAKVIAGSKRERVFLNTKVSVWSSNRNAIFKAIYDSLPGSEQAKAQSKVSEELERRKALDPDHICHYFGGQEGALRASLLSNAMERKYGDRVDRPSEYRDRLLASVDSSLRALGTDYLDLLMVPHGANSAYEVTAFPEIFEAFETLRQAGKVRHFGLSAHSDPGGVLEGAVESGQYSAAMVAYNIINHSYVDAALDRAQAADLGVIAMKVARPCHHGRDNGLPDDPRRVAIIERAVPGELSVPQKCYLWVLRDSRIAAVNSELKNSATVADNLPLAGAKRA
ncbi:MAG: aldo/keto reductase [Bryobacterales bacterium]|nr:aldo/keto reductase [Bryobacterales bacterium]